MQGTQDCFKHLGAEGEVDTSNMRFKRTLEERASGMTGEEVLQVREETKNELWTTPQVFECNTPSPGVGYRHSPDFADKVVQTVAMCPCAFPVYCALSVVCFATRCSTYVLYDWMLSCRSKHQTV